MFRTSPPFSRIQNIYLQGLGLQNHQFYIYFQVKSNKNNKTKNKTMSQPKLQHPFDFSNWKNMDKIIQNIEHRISQYEKYLDEYTLLLSGNADHDTLEHISSLTSMLNEMYFDYESILTVRSTLCN